MHARERETLPVACAGPLEIEALEHRRRLAAAILRAERTREAEADRGFELRIRRLHSTRELERPAELGRRLAERAQRRVARAGAEQMARRLEPVAGAVVVVADPRRAVGTLSDRELRQHVGRRAVEAGAALAHQLRVGAAPHDAVAEIELARRGRREEAARLELGERALRIARRGGLHGDEELGRERLAEDRGRLEEALRRLGQRVDARRDDTLECLRDAIAEPRERHLRARRVAHRVGALAECARDLLDEERVAAAAEPRELGEVVRAVDVAEHVPREPKRVLLGERAEAERRARRGARKDAGLVVAERGNEGERAGQRRRGKLLEEAQRRRVEPLRVVEDEEQRRVGEEAREERAHRARDGLGRRVGAGTSLERAERGRRLRRRARIRPGAEQLEPGPVGALHAGLVACERQRARAFGQHARDLAREPRLSDARLAPDLDAPDRRIARERAADVGDLRVAPDERGVAAIGLARAPRVGGELGHELVDARGLGEPAQRAAPEIRELEARVRAPCRDLGDEDLARRRLALEARGEPDRRALCGVVAAQRVADHPDPDEAGRHADADRERHPVARAHRLRVGPRLLAHLERRAERAHRIVAARARRAEERHEAVAAKLVDRAAFAVDRLHGECEEAVHDGVNVFGIECFGHRERAGDVRDEDGHLLALAGLGVAGEEHGLEMRGSVVRRPLRLRREGGAAAEAKAALRRQVGETAASARERPGIVGRRGVTPRRAIRRRAGSCTAGPPRRAPAPT